LVARVTPSSILRIDDAGVNLAVIGYAAALSLATAVGFGLLPALRASRFNLAGALGGDGRRTAAAPASPARPLLVPAEVALAVALLPGAALVIRSVARLLGVSPGFDPDRVLTLQLSMIGARYADDADVVRIGDAMLDRVRALPGVASAALAGQIPLGG